MNHREAVVDMLVELKTDRAETWAVIAVTVFGVLIGNTTTGRVMFVLADDIEEC